MTYKKKLIEVALPLAAISAAASSEKSLRHGHPANLHLWWARRPLVAARAIVWASLVDDPSSRPDEFLGEEAQALERKRLFALLERLVLWDSTDDRETIQLARQEIERCYPGGVPCVADPFGGGGAIPLEAQRLGLGVVSGDLNPVAVIIQRAMMELVPRFADRPPINPEEMRLESAWSGASGLAADLRWYGERLRESTSKRVGSMYPDVSAPDGRDLRPIGWIWARTVESPDPAWSGHVPLVKNWVLSQKRGMPVVWVKPMVDATSQQISYVIRKGGDPQAGTVDRSGATCVATGAPIPFEYIREQARQGLLGDVLLAVAAEGNRRREYFEPTSHQVDAALVNAPVDFPQGRLPEGGLGFRVQNYGLDEWWKLFTNRQLTVMLALSEELTELRHTIEDDARRTSLPSDAVPLRDGGKGPTAYADAIVTLLALVISRFADFSNALARWKVDAECPVQLFGRQAVSFVWDYVEVNPFSESSGSLFSMIKRCADALDGRAFRLFNPGTAHIAQMDAEARIRQLNDVVVITDPPYYDNIGYADLSDFFYIWLRKNLRSVWPDEFSTLLTPKAEELIADPDRHGSREGAVDHFETGMERFFAAVAEAQSESAPASIFYAFKQAEESADGRTSTGWETFLHGLLSSGLAITATWPVRTEMRGGLRNLGRNSLASSVVLTCRPRPADAPMATRSEFLTRLSNELPPALRRLQELNIAPVDMAQSAIGPGMAVFSRYAKVLEADGSTMSVRQALALINEALQEALSKEETEFDGDTRWALTWYEQNGMSPGPYGDAETLSKAKNTSVAGVIQAGIAAQRDGKIRLVKRDGLGAEWDPRADTRLTVWEATQNLIARLDESESAAAELLRRLGSGVGERARQLAYLLFLVADRRGWTEEAVAYNTLVQAWPDLVKLAGRSESPVQPTLGE